MPAVDVIEFSLNIVQTIEFDTSEIVQLQTFDLILTTVMPFESQIAQLILFPDVER